MSGSTTTDSASRSDSAYPRALSPIRLGPVDVRNRILVAAHGTNFQIGGLPSDRYIAYLAERARGGVGLIITEGTHVHPTSGGPYMIDAWRRDGRERFESLSAAVRAEGGRLFAQLMHNGRQQEPVMTGRPAVGPSPITDPAHTTMPHELSNAEILELVEGYADSAENLADAGFDGVEMHFAHGYLVEQFLSPWSNHRTDQWGGSHENRLRFARSIVRAVLDRVGDRMAVGTRMTAYETVPGGLDRDEALDMTAAVAAEGLTFVSITMGQHATPFMVVPPAGIPTLPFREEIARAKRTVDCAVFASHRVRDLADAEQALQDGIADMVAMTRAHIADPYLVAKAQSGRAREIRPCIGCVQGCRGQLLNGLPIGCLVNPRAGHELVSLPAPTPRRTRIAVVGGGIAGMQFAATSGGRGNDVTIFERGEKLGGLLDRSSVLPERTEVARFTDALYFDMIRQGVTVELGHDIAPADLGGFDEVVVAIGADRRVPGPADFPEATVPVVGLDEAMPPTSGDPISSVLIVDRGDHYNAAILLARKYLAEGAASVTLVDTSGPVARKLDPLNKAWMSRDLDPKRVRLAAAVKGLTITDRRASFRHEGWEQTVDGLDLVVVLEPAVARDRTPWEGCAPRVRFLGDCDAPGLAVEIVHHAYEAAGDLRPANPPSTGNEGHATSALLDATADR